MPAYTWTTIKLKELSEAGFSSYVEDMFFFLFTLAANYPRAFTPDTQAEKYYRRFFQVLPETMRHRPWGETMREYLRENPLSERGPLTGRDQLMQWVHGMYTRVVPDPKPLGVIRDTMEQMRK